MDTNIIKLGITGWSSWLPRDGHAICVSHRAGERELDTLDQPSLQSVPAMQRRRLGKLARVVFHVLGKAMGDVFNEQVIFSSRMGEIQRTQTILESIATDTPVSPANFSLSVHNAIAGQWSMIHKVHQPLLALAPGNGGPVPALLEAFAHLASGEADSITIVCFEENYPEFYAPFLKGPAAPTAVAVQFSLEHPIETLILERSGDNTGTQTIGFAPLTELLLAGKGNVEFRDQMSCWQVRLAA